MTETMCPLPTRQLGRGGPAVTAVGLGLMGLSAFYNVPTSDQERFSLLDRAYELGEWNWDSADAYMDSEDLIGAWFKANPGKRSKIFLATKFGNVRAKDRRYIDSSPEYAKEACEKSLKRLGVPFIDLYYCHRLDRKTPIEMTVQAMVQLKNEGKIKFLGLSECSAESLRRAHKVYPISAVQVEYSPFSLEIESSQVDLLRTCRELGVAIVAYSPIGRGMLTGTLRSPEDLAEGDSRRMWPRFSKENFPKNLQLVDKICAIAKRKSVTPSQLTLAWLMAQGADIIPIPGTTKPERIEENIGAINIKLTSEEEAEVREACSTAEVAGTRYPASAMASLFADTPQFGL